jgi:hypothetical protein
MSLGKIDLGVHKVQIKQMRMTPNKTKLVWAGLRNSGTRQANLTD